MDRSSARGLRDRINRVSHFDVNVSDLERARAFYESTTPLMVTAELEAAQDFPSLGIRGGRFRGYRLESTTQSRAFPAIHLIQWIDPAPVGLPYAHHANRGWYRICVGVGDIDAARKRVEAAGSIPFQPTSDFSHQHAGPGIPPTPYRMFVAPDPDGIAVEWVYDWRAALEAEQRSGLDAEQYYAAKLRTDVERIMTVANNTADVDRHLSFYTDILGLDFVTGVQTPTAVPNLHSVGGGDTSFEGALFGTRGERGFFLSWLTFSETRDLGPAYAEPHHLGIVRCAFEVDDLDLCYRILAEASHDGQPVADLTEPEVWELGPGLGAVRTVTFADPDGNGFQLIEQPTSKARLHPWSDAESGESR